MYQKKYDVVLKGCSSLLLHRDNIDWAGKVKSWLLAPENKKLKTNGDDRTPAWTWLGCLYHANGVLTMDSDNIMSMLRDGGKKIPSANGRGSLKSATQSGISTTDIGWPLYINGKAIKAKPLFQLEEELDFDVHLTTVQKAGFELHIKRARVGNAKHIRVRPLFSNWEIKGMLIVTDPSITQDILLRILTFAGQYSGIGDWRPGATTPGRMGTFSPIIAGVIE